MNIYQPYTYLIGWSKLDYWYYGCEFGTSKKRANPKNLWTTYFTSSKYVAMMREWHGEPDVIEVRKVFRSRNQALRCEEKVLDKINATKSSRWLNRGNRGRKFHIVSHSPETREKISIALTGKNHRPGYRHSLETIEKLRQSKLGNKNRVGCKHSSETRKRMSHSQTIRWGKLT